MSQTADIYIEHEERAQAIERIALAICRADAMYNGFAPADDLEECEAPDFYRELARAALAAMR